jgi:hypothetical protein
MNEHDHITNSWQLPCPGVATPPVPLRRLIFPVEFRGAMDDTGETLSNTSEASTIDVVRGIFMSVVCIPAWMRTLFYVLCPRHFSRVSSLSTASWHPCACVVYIAAVARFVFRVYPIKSQTHGSVESMHVRGKNLR